MSLDLRRCQVHVDPSIFGRSFRMYLLGKDPQKMQQRDGRVFPILQIPTKIEWADLPSGGELGDAVPPTFELGALEAQELMDRLWSAGLRPSEGTGSAGALAAAQGHLADMRRITFDLLDRSKAPADPVLSVLQGRSTHAPPVDLKKGPGRGDD